ncbi:MAG: ferrous iron transport protein A [Fimbriimonadaceae bacterium]|nr:ferrous iron transport protein A [Fimbriimonadaceae bacterium]
MSVNASATSMLDFAKVKKGMRAKVVQVPNDGPLAKRLQEMGLVEGTQFTVVKVAPLGDPIEIDLRGYRLCLRKRESAGLMVELVE